MAIIAPIENRMKNFFRLVLRFVFREEKKIPNAISVIKIRNQTS